MNPTQEQWRPVVGYEGIYEVSDHGRVRSLDRIKVRRDGVKVSVSGRALSPTPRRDCGHLQIHLYGPDGAMRTVRVHQLVLEAFVGPCPEGLMACHWDDDPTNNHVSNLRWDTHQSNMRDRVRNGRQRESLQTHCKWGHEFTPENTIVSWPKNRSGERRKCRTCVREWSRQKRVQGREAAQNGMETGR